MRVLLIYFSQTGYLLPAPPIGLSYIAKATRAAGHAVEMLDLLFSRNPDGDLRPVLRTFRPDVVGISVRNIDNLTQQRSEWHLDELSRRLSEIRRECHAKIVLGGPAINILGASALSGLDADFAMTGESEVGFPMLLSALETHGRYDHIAGLCYRDGDTIVATPSMRLNGFGSSGMEEWIDWRAYERRGGTWAIQSMRGCPMSCIYCPFPSLEGRVSRRRPAEEVVDEIERVMSTRRPRTFEFVDSVFNIPQEHALSICETIIRRRLKVNLSAMGVYPSAVSEELFPLMKRAGFNSMMIAPEAGNDVMLLSLGKGFTMESVHRTARLARQSGIPCAWFFMVGGPGETRETIESTVSFAERHLNWKDCLTIFTTGIRILGGTELARIAMEEGELSPGTDLTKPVFYVSPQVNSDWIVDRINRAIRVNGAIVHAADQGDSFWNRALYAGLYWAGLAPPYWRFLPRILRFPPVHRMHLRHPLAPKPPGDRVSSTARSLTAE